MSLHMLGADAPVPFDVGTIQLQFNKLTSMTLAQARTMSQTGMSVINHAIDVASGHWYAPGSAQAGSGNRDEVHGHLNWHVQNLSTGPLATADPNSQYPSFDDLKHWTMQAFIEANAVSSGDAYLQGAWSDMWSEIGTGVLQAPAKILKTAISATSTALLPIIPRWVQIGGVVVLLGAGGWVLYRFVGSKLAFLGHAA